MTELQKKFKDDYITLVEAGFIAVNQADEDAAVKLFRAAGLLRPDNTFPQVGLGYLHLCKLELKEACRYFEEVLKKEPANEMAKAFLGLTLSLTPHKIDEGEKVLIAAAKEAKDPTVKQLAEDTIQFVEKYLRKTPSPAELSAPKSGKTEKESSKKKK